jgi:hypothetical protein
VHRLKCYKPALDRFCSRLTILPPAGTTPCSPPPGDQGVPCTQGMRARKDPHRPAALVKPVPATGHPGDGCGRREGAGADRCLRWSMTGGREAWSTSCWVPPRAPAVDHLHDMVKLGDGWSSSVFVHPPVTGMKSLSSSYHRSAKTSSCSPTANSLCDLESRTLGAVSSSSRFQIGVTRFCR